MADEDADEDDAKLNEQQIQEFQDAFELFDRDNDGNITIREFFTIMRAFAQTHYESDLETMFIEADVDETGTINFVQFLRVMEENYTDDCSADGISEAFRAFDTLKKGFIMADDLREFMMSYGDKLTEEEANEMIKMADMNKDGKIMYEYFVSTMADKLEKKNKYARKFKDPESKKNKK